jgi:hypothetical protein
MSLAAKLPYDHPYAGGFSGIGSQPLPTDSDCLTYLAAVKAADGAGVEVSVATAVDAFVKELKATPGLFDAIKASCILCGARTLSGAFVPLAGTAPTNNNFIPADYTRGGATPGLKADGSTKYLDSNYAVEAVADYHQSVYVTSKPTAGSSFMSSDDTAQERYLLYFNTDEDETRAISGKFTSGVDLAYLGGAGTLDPGFKGVSRSNGSNFVGRSNAINQTVTGAAGNLPDLNLFVFARNESGVAENINDARLAFYSSGEFVDLASLDDAVSALVTTIGAVV